MVDFGGIPNSATLPVLDIVSAVASEFSSGLKAADKDTLEHSPLVALSMLNIGLDFSFPLMHLKELMNFQTIPMIQKETETL